MPAAAASDLALWLGRDDVDLQRADYLMGLARDWVVITSGLPVSSWPAGLEAVQLSAAVRAYTNPAFKGQDSVGSRQFTVRDIGILMTDAERKALRRAGGQGDLQSARLESPADALGPVLVDGAWVFRS
jgi:hypothetical protein